MLTLTVILGILITIWMVAYFAVPLWGWSLGLLLGLSILTAFGFLQASAYILLPLTIGVVALLNIPILRRPLLSAPIFKWFAQVLPPMSSTERSAIEAGTTWWEADIYRGHPNWTKLNSIPAPTLTSEEQNYIDTKLQTLCEMLDDWHICQEKADLPAPVWQYMRDNKFFGMIIPKSFGGLEFSAYAQSVIVTKIATRSIAAAVTVMVPNSLGPAELLIAYGTTKQKNFYLPRLAGGKDVPCFALTAPEAGSDAGAIPDNGVVCMGEYQGEEVLGIRLQFDKRYITLAPVATVMGLAFKLYDPNQLLGNQTDLGITVCLIPTDYPGISIGQRHVPLDIAFMNGPIRGKDVFIPMEFIIGGQAMVGQGWRMLMECLSAGRGISLPALGTGAGAISYITTGAYAAIRKQFNVSIGAFEGIQEAMAQIAGNALKLEATRQLTAQGVDIVHKPSVASAIGKCHMTELARKSVSYAMDVHAGKAIIMGPMNYIGRIYQAIPICITVEGANILTRSLMIFGQGAIRCHPFVKAEIDAVELAQTEPANGLKSFDKLLIQHIGFFATNKARCFAKALTRGRLTKAPNQFKSYYQKISWLSSGLAFCSEVSMMFLGGSLKRRERLSARLGDILSQLYMASAVLRYHANAKPDEALDHLTEWVLQQTLFETQEAFYGFFRNFPNRWLAFSMKVCVFPYGKAFGQPSDRLDGQVASDMLHPTQLRADLRKLCFIGEGIEDPTGLVELAFSQLNACQPLLEKINLCIKTKVVAKDAVLGEQIQQALKANQLTPEEAQRLQEYDTLRQKIIAVDEFSPNTQLGSETKWSQKQVTIQAG